MAGGNKQYFTEILELVRAIVVGNVARVPIMTGLSLVTIDRWDVIVFALQLLFGKANADVPGVDLGLLGWMGALFLMIGVALHLWLAMHASRLKNAEAVTNFFANYRTLSQPEFQGQLKALFGMGNVSSAAARNVLAHPDNQNGAFDYFRVCHPYVRADGNWLALHSKWHVLLYRLGNLFALLILFNFFLCVVAAVAEFGQAGLLGSGNRRGAVVAALALANLVGLFILKQDLSRRGHAMTLLKMRP
ncbi:hypothetical protein [Pseudoduganella sp.]|uniref:hypothetical protein n=1 Tax=Pseudoduganella sp. TaxID=1880898 RepID=UPI0035B21153